MRRTIVFITIAALACHRGERAAAPRAATATTAERPSAGVGDRMPPYAAKLLDGAPYELASEKGNVVLVNVWATWCLPCRAEIPELQKLHDEYAKRGFKVVGISVDEGDVAEVKKFVAEQKMTYPVGLDPDGRIANLLQTMVLPTSVLVDRNGTIVWRHTGALAPSDVKLTSAIVAALGGGQS